MANVMSAIDERRQRRQAKFQKAANTLTDSNETPSQSRGTTSDEKLSKLLLKNEDDLLKFVAGVNKVYEEKLRQPAPFMTFVICGMQSSGKSTVMERFMNAVLNIVQEGTGTRCPLDTTCIHDDSLKTPMCDISGLELDEGGGENLNVEQVFETITNHNKSLAKQDKFSTTPLRLVYRASNVQNMRFVDTPGIIRNRGQGKDNREDIKKILKETMMRANTKLCVLLEPKEFSTNPIIDFCDDTFGSRDEWTHRSVFLMTKFDKQLEDARSGSRTNNFFNEFNSNGIYPHLVITPTLAKEDLPPKKLFEDRLKLLEDAGIYEETRFSHWLTSLKRFRETDPDDPDLGPSLKERIGFKSAKDVMRSIMLSDTARRLPEVLKALRQELGKQQNLEKSLKEKIKYNDPKEIKYLVGQLMECIQRRITSYLDGDLETALRYEDKMKNLHEELDDEEESEWAGRELNHFTELEDEWRDRISNLDEYPTQIQADKKFLGGKQVQRALELLKVVMIDAIPDPFQLREYVPSGAGYLQGGLKRENWERATMSIVKVTIKKSSHPGINYLIKHVGHIFRHLFAVAFEDVKHGTEFAATFKMIPMQIETYLSRKFDDMIWELMKTASDRIHVALEPMYSTLNPFLPTFHAIHKDEDDETYTKDHKGAFVKLKPKKEKVTQSMIESVTTRMTNLFTFSNGESMKKVIKEDNLKKASQKKHFLPDERTPMMTDDENTKVILMAFQYMIALLEFNMTVLEFQINHYLYAKFKDNLISFGRLVLQNEKEWASILDPDDDLEVELKEVEENIEGLTNSLQEVQKIQMKF